MSRLARRFHSARHLSLAKVSVKIEVPRIIAYDYITLFRNRRANLPRARLSRNLIKNFPSNLLRLSIGRAYHFCVFTWKRRKMYAPTRMLRRMLPRTSSSRTSVVVVHFRKLNFKRSGFRIATVIIGRPLSGLDRRFLARQMVEIGKSRACRSLKME